VPGSVTAIVTDLIFATRIRSAAEALGVGLQVIRTLDALADRLADAGNQLLMVDLNADGLDPLAAIRQAKEAAPSVHVIAFVSHVQVELAAAARKAGADQVMARSAFVTRLPALLGEFCD
jgi:DNA-binding NarL/FixJ family response regulator